MKSTACDLTTERSGAGAGATLVRSLAQSLAGSVSPAVDTQAEFVTEGMAAAPTATSSVKLELLPFAMGANRIAVTTWPALLNVQPEPVAETNVSPVGSVSVTVITPLVGAVPTLLAVSV